MQLDRKHALKIWEAAFGKAVESTDFVGRKINKSAYDQKSSKYGWEVVYKLPKAQGGRDNEENLLCVHVETAKEKGDEFPCFVANDRKYRIAPSEEDESKWVIDIAVDEESIAEQEAKTAAAHERWNELFGTEYEKAVDFCGRMIYKSEYNTDSEYAWKVAPYVDSKPMENKNAYIANLASIEEALGKTAFKANGKNFTLNKDNGSYYFKALEPKPVKPDPEPVPTEAPVEAPVEIAEEKPAEKPIEKPAEKTFNVKDPYDVASKIVEIGSSYQNGANSGVMLDFIVIRAVTKPGAGSATAATVNDTVSMILKEGIGDCITVEVSEMVDEQGVRYMFMTYRFASPQPADFERIFLGAKLLNSYSPVLLAALGLDELKIYNYASFVDCAHVKYPVALLSGYYPQLRALMDSIYGSAYGFYAGECTTTLYVSHFIVFNVPSLAQMHPENATQYYTEAEMVEHNYPLDDVSNAIRRMLSGEPEEETPAAVEEPSKSENEKAEKAVTEGVADIETPNQENTAPVEETVATDENEPSSAPVTDETSDKTTEAASADETNAVEAEAEVEKEIETERSVDNEEIAPPTQAQMLANTLASALAHTETEAPAVKIPAFPPIAAVADKETEPQVVKTPEGDQITLDITEAQSDDDGIITLDLDSID